MHLYLIRHGQTELGKRFHLPNPETPLSEQGRIQADNVAKTLASIFVSKVYTSPFTRAQETAAYVAMAHGTPLVQHEFFREKMYPNGGYGRSYLNFGFVKLAYATLLGLVFPNYHIADEETMLELMNRAKYAKGFLESHEEDTVVVVSHSLFMSAFLDTILLHRIPRIFRVIYVVIRAAFIKNTQIFHLQYTDEKGWKKIS